MDFTPSFDDSFILLCQVCRKLNFDPEVCLNCDAAISPSTRIKVLRRNNEVIEITAECLSVFPKSAYRYRLPYETLSSKSELKVRTDDTSRFSSNLTCIHREYSACAEENTSTAAEIKKSSTEKCVAPKEYSNEKDYYNEYSTEEEEYFYEEQEHARKKLEQERLGFTLLKKYLEKDSVESARLSLENFRPFSPHSQNSNEGQEMAVETQCSTIPSSFLNGPNPWLDKKRKRIEKETTAILPATNSKNSDRDSIVTLGILSKPSDKISTNGNDNKNCVSNRTSNADTGFNALNNLEQNLKRKVDSESLLIEKSIIETDVELNNKKDENINASSNSINSDNLKKKSTDTELSITFEQNSLGNSESLKCIKEVCKSHDIKNLNSSLKSSSMATKVHEPDLEQKLPVKTKNKSLLACNAENVDIKSDASKLQRNKKRKKSHEQGTTSPKEYKLRNSSTSSVKIKKNPADKNSSKIKEKKSIPLKDKLIRKKKVLSDTNFKPKDNTLSEAEMKNVENNSTTSPELLILDKANEKDSKIIEVNSITKSNKKNIEQRVEVIKNSPSLLQLESAKVFPWISINSHFTNSSVISVKFHCDGIHLELPRFKASTKIFSTLLSDLVVDHLDIYCDEYSVAFISIRTSPSHGQYLKDQLKFNNKTSPYYTDDPKTKNADQLIISFLMCNVTDDIIPFLHSKFSMKKLNVINREAARKKLISPVPTSDENSLPMTSTSNLTYSPIGGIPLTDEDIARLAIGKKLNDTIIDTYLDHIYHEEIPKEFQARTHIFGAFFWINVLHQGKKKLDMKCVKCVKNVDLFSKDFIFVPLNRGKHWYLAVICFLTQVNKKNDEITLDSDLETKSKESVDKATNADDNTRNTRRKDYHYLDKGIPSICFFDSLDRRQTVNADKKAIARTLKEFLKLAWKSKNPTESCDFDNLLFLKAVCPQQENRFDCGIYLLQYVESFFKNPIPYFANPMPDLKNWFPKNNIIHKRAKIRKVISKRKENQPQTINFEASCSSDIIALS